MTTDKFLIEDNDLELAQNTCKLINNPDIRNRAVANVLAANIAEKFFDNTEYTVDTKSGLHNIGAILSDIDIADIYLNNSYVDVRVYFNDDELSVPKSHFQNGILPVAYMFIKLTPDLSGASVTGFILPENINTENEDISSYRVNENDLVSFFDVSPSIANVEDNYEVEDAQIFAYLDNKLSDKAQFYRTLIASVSGRLRLAKAVKAQYVFNFISTPEPLASAAFSELNTSDAEYDDSADFEVIIQDSESDISEALQDVEPEEIAYNYSTVTSSGDTEEQAANVIELTEELLDTSDKTTAREETIKQAEAQAAAPEEINTLFNTEVEENQDIAGYNPNFIPQKKQSSLLLPLIIVLLAVAVGIGGYMFYTNTQNVQSQNDNFLAPPLNQESENDITEAPVQDAMPIETVNVEQTKNSTDEGNAIAIPAIEQNLDASILVSNLKVDWEVPAGYASNTSAKRYLIKLGKIIQLNLKTELLLLSKPPITNKITVELQYNNSSRKFEAVGIVTSSGEKSVDDLIMQTLKKALSMNLNINTDSFGKLQGNPTLIIHL